MVARFHQNFTDEMGFQAKKRGFSEYDMVILASIIEKETGVTRERRLISAVLHNRLKKKMKLFMDPTVIYGVYESFKGDLTKKHLRTKTSYNTYIIEGLPAGPIANPGRAALEAAVSPAPVDYLYFVARGDGSHFFSSTLRDHINAVNRYQKRRKKK